MVEDMSGLMVVRSFPRGPRASGRVGVHTPILTEEVVPLTGISPALLHLLQMKTFLTARCDAAVMCVEPVSCGYQLRVGRWGSSWWDGVSLEDGDEQATLLHHTHERFRKRLPW